MSIRRSRFLDRRLEERQLTQSIDRETTTTITESDQSTTWSDSSITGTQTFRLNFRSGDFFARRRLDWGDNSESKTLYEETQEVEELNTYLMEESLFLQPDLQAIWNSRATYEVGTGAINTQTGDDQNNAYFSLDAPDVLTGRGGDDLLVGGKQDDLALGGSGNDYILGEAGNDSLWGDSGNDFLVGGSGADTINGGLGTDTAVFAGAMADYEITNNGDKIIVASKSDSSDVDEIENVEYLKFSDGLISTSTLEVTTPPSGTDSEGEPTEEPSGEDTTASTPILEAPSLLEVAEGQQEVALTISASLTDTDGSETLKIYVTGLPEGAVLSAGTEQSDGSWALDASDLGGLMINLSQAVTFASLALTITAVSVEANGGDEAFAYETALLRSSSEAGETAPPPTIEGQVTYFAPDASEVGAIVGLTFENSDGAKATADYQTFGHVFVEGDVPAGAGLTMLVGGVEVPVQMDVKATWADGSAKHAVLTVMVPEIAANTSIEGFLKVGSGPSGATLDAMDVLNAGLDVDVTLAFYNSTGSKQQSKNYDVATLFAEAMNEGRLETWLEGPYAAEFSFTETTPEGLELRFDIRVFEDGDIRTDVTFANEHTYTESVTLTYDATIRQNGSVVESYTALDHYRNSNWHTQVWDGDQSSAFTKFDIVYMANTGAIPHYDPSLGITASVLDDGLDANYDPMGEGMIKKYMPATGGRVDLGILPEWATNYLISQDETAYEVMMLNGDAAGSVPWHFVDEATGEYVSIIDHPNLWLDGRQTSGEDALTTRFQSPNDWALDSAHHPSLSFIPYLITGDQYHLDNMLAAATFQFARVPPSGRERGAEGFLVVDRGAYQQVRGTAWALRTWTEATFLMPDDHALQEDFDYLLNVNLDYLVERYITDGRFDDYGDIEGFFESYGFYDENSSEYGRISPWMNDFLYGVLGLVAERGFEQGTDLVEWSTSFLANRYLSEDEGMDPIYGSSYRFQVTDPDTQLPYTSFGEMMDATFEAGTDHLGYNYHSYSYTAYARAALASTITATGDIEAIEAFGWITNHQYENNAFEQNNDRSYLISGQWLVMPEMGEGIYLMQSNVTFGGGTLIGDGNNEMIYGSDSADTIKGLGGIDWLFGAGGNDVLEGGDGHDILFGGDHADQLIGGSGDDQLVGGFGVDTFIFDSADFGHDLIHDYDYLEDRILLSGLSQSDLDAMIANAYVTEEGLVLKLDNENSITLKGLEMGDIGKIDFDFG